MIDDFATEPAALIEAEVAGLFAEISIAGVGGSARGACRCVVGHSSGHQITAAIPEDHLKCGFINSNGLWASLSLKGMSMFLN